MINLILLIVATVLSLIFYITGFIYATLRLIIKGKFKELSHYYWICALSMDQTGNAICQYLFNDLMIKPEGYRLGNEDETVSHGLGINKKQQTLYPLGKFLCWILDKIDKNHVENASTNNQ